MRRLNPDTGELFKQGEWRDDGFRFWGYSKKRKSKKTGYVLEFWRSNEKYEEELEKIVKWQAGNRDKMNATAAIVRAKRRNRKPKWIKDVFIEDIKIWYRRAKLIKQFTGQLWEVDHIVPLNGKKVSGLHVPWNLQLLTKKQNRDKSNTHAN
jgi:5-methylcytosine-specific restriction endonuclease McrA